MNAIKHTTYWWILKLSRSNKVFRFFIDIAAYLYYKIFRADNYFIIKNKKYKYFYHLYNRTVAGERIVEIPIIYEYVKRYKSKEILEVGNVLSHYFSVTHDILDKYEKGTKVINKDIVNYKFKKKYDLIVSISTMEHVGFNYGEKNQPEKFLKAIANLKKYLRKNGLLVVTLPIYFNPNITKLITKRKMPFSKEYFMKRINYLNEWEQVDYNEAIAGSKYDQHFANSNVLYIGIYKKIK